MLVLLGRVREIFGDCVRVSGERTRNSRRDRGVTP